MTLVPAGRKDEEFRDRAATSIPGFVDSEQYGLLDADDRKIPGLVFAALAAYVLVLEERILKGTAAAGASIAIEHALHVFEEMAASGDDQLKNLLVTEVYENWDESEASELLRSRFGPEADALYRRWIERTSH